MILSLESYSAVIIRLDLSRDCPPYDPVTPPQTTRTKLSFSFAIVPTYWAAAYLFIIIIMIVIMIILCLVCIVCANAPAPSQLRLRTMPSLAVREISLSQLSSEFWILYGNFRLLSHRFVIVLGNKFPPTYDHNVHSLRRVKGCHNAQKNWRRWNGNNRNR